MALSEANGLSACTSDRRKMRDIGIEGGTARTALGANSGTVQVP